MVWLDCNWTIDSDQSKWLRIPLIQILGAYYSSQGTGLDNCHNYNGKGFISKRTARYRVYCLTIQFLFIVYPSCSSRDWKLKRQANDQEILNAAL